MEHDEGLIDAIVGIAYVGEARCIGARPLHLVEDIGRNVGHDADHES